MSAIRLMTSQFLDRTTVFAVTTRGWNALAGFVTAIVITWSLSPEIQGYYFAISGVLTLQTLVELGFGTAVQQFASHEWARLGLDSQGSVCGDDCARERLASLTSFAFRWYLAIACLIVAGIGTGGYVYFLRFSDSSAGVGWQGPWWIACLLAASVCLVTPALSILEGCNQISGVYGLQLAQSVLSRGALWGVLLLGGGLWALPAAKGITLAVGAGFLHWRYRRFFGSLLAGRPSRRNRGRPGFWPLQWRLAVSWLGGYLLFSLFTPVLFAFHGPVVAGQMGMTLSLVGALSSACYAVVGVRVPQFALAAARRDYPNLDRLFRQATVASVLASAAGAAGLGGALALARALEIPLAERFLPPVEAGILLLAVVIQQVRYAMGSYLRAHKEEPYAVLSILEGVLAVTGLSFLGARFGARAMAAGFLAMTAALLVPATAVFVRSRRHWQGIGRGSGVVSEAVP